TPPVAAAGDGAAGARGGAADPAPFVPPPQPATPAPAPVEAAPPAEVTAPAAPLVVQGAIPLDGAAGPAAAGSAALRSAREAVLRLPLRFEANRGQVAGPADFVARGPGYNLFLSGPEAVLVLGRPGAAGSVLRMKVVGGQGGQAEAQGQLA